MRIDQIFKAWKCAVDNFAQGLQGKVSIARDPYNVFELLAANPAGYLIIMHWAGDQQINEVFTIPLLRHRLEFIIARNLGMTAKPDQALLDTIASQPPLFQNVDDLRTLLMSLQVQDPSTGGNLEYIGTEPVVTPEGVTLAAYRLIFGFRAVPSTSANPVPI